MKRTLPALFLFLMIAVPVFAQRVDIGIQSSIVFQALEQENDGNTLPRLAPGFQNAVGNVTLRAEAFPGGEVAVDFFLSSKHHQEMYGSQGYFRMTQLPSWMELGGLNDFWAEHLEVKAGQMTLGYGDGYLYQSVNGFVTNNELIGNAIVRPALTAIGAEATLRNGPASVLLGFSNGTTKGDLSRGKGIAVHGKLSYGTDDNRISVSGYRVDHSGNGLGFGGNPPGGTKDYLYQGGDRAGTRYDVWATGGDGGEIFLGKGQDMSSVQLDARGTFGPLLVYGAAGLVADRDINGTATGPDGVFDTNDDIDNSNPRETWRYGMATVRYNLTPWLYLAGRYSLADAATLETVDANGAVQSYATGTADRWQVGAGFRLHKSIIMKAEYVNQSTNGFGVGYSNNGTDLGKNPRFSGFSLETAVTL